MKKPKEVENGIIQKKHRQEAKCKENSFPKLEIA